MIGRRLDIVIFIFTFEIIDTYNEYRQENIRNSIDKELKLI